ncbi:MAG TPA: ABC transporter ATP-binding protein [Candidatus Methylomirabilis sp.]|nr:ABC transporter ATP-binding protein [Candidatus Methylomirabilis sp.]
MDSTSRSAAIPLLRRLLKQVRPYWLQIAGILLLDVAATPLALLTPLPLKIAIDSVIGSDPLPAFLQVLVPGLVTGSALRLLLAAASMQVLIVLAIRLRDLCSYVLRTRTGEGLILSFRTRLFRHVQRLSLSFHDSRGTADAVYRIQYDAPSIQGVTLDGIVPIASSGLMLVAMIWVIARINGKLALVALAVCPFVFLLGHTYDRRMGGRYMDLKELESRALKVVHEALTAVRVVKAFGREDAEEERFVHRSREGAQARIHLAFAEGAIVLAVNLVTAIGAAMVLFIGIRDVRSGLLTLGELLMVVAYLSQLYGPLETICSRFAGLQSSMAGMRRAFALLEEVPEVVERPQALPLKRAAGAIEFRNVSFAYEQRNLVLREVSFAVPARTHLGIAGSTGAGKTTLVSLLTRFYDPTVGQILVDGVDLREYRLADLRNQFAIVLQEPVLFSTSVGENIAYARPEASEQEIVEAARLASAHDFIIRLPEGYQTQVGERGMALSGGERQRISLARAFLKDAPILILDEPTSSVDMGTEAAILEAMERLMQGRTAFIIAHRPAMLAACDALLTVEHGQVVAMGSEALTVPR